MRRSSLWVLPTVALLAVTAACGSSASGGTGGDGGGSKVSLKLADDFPATDPINTFLGNFAKDVTARTKGDVKVTLYDGDQLGERGRHRKLSRTKPSICPWWA